MRREEEEASPAPAKASRRDTGCMFVVGDGEPGPTVPPVRGWAAEKGCGETFRTRELPHESGEEEDEVLFGDALARIGPHLPMRCERVTVETGGLEVDRLRRTRSGFQGRCFFPRSSACKPRRHSNAAPLRKDRTAKRRRRPGRALQPRLPPSASRPCRMCGFRALLEPSQRLLRGFADERLVVSRRQLR
jgi:hypothetical protein